MKKNRITSNMYVLNLPGVIVLVTITVSMFRIAAAGIDFP